ncbi:hypothetical protein F8M41_009202 [Gigaspora margarita]|uniref:Uncharacterized protein n=1 Tax=Gigaspora margarita TaxID=4874 RepID=A0A8H4AV47_GIGMA|nr:hypothetical protein F8M41_009202 [Gigaspora margarita]
MENFKKDQGNEFQDLDPIIYSSTIQENAIYAKDINLDRQSKSIKSGSDEYDDTDEEINEIIFDALASSCAKSKEISSAKNVTSQDRTTKSEINEVFKVAKNNYVKHNGIKHIPSTLTEDSPLPSENEAVSDLGISEDQLNSKNSYNNKVNEPVNKLISDIKNVENERTSIINKPNIGPVDVPFVFVNNSILEFFVDKSKEPKTSNDSILVEDNDSDEEIEEQENLARKRKLTEIIKCQKKQKK